MTMKMENMIENRWQVGEMDDKFITGIKLNGMDEWSNVMQCDVIW